MADQRRSRKHVRATSRGEVPTPGLRPLNAEEQQEYDLLRADGPAALEHHNAVALEAKRLRVQEAARSLVAAERVNGNRGKARAYRGDEFALDLPPESPSLWGGHPTPLWAAGEPLLLVGSDGVGKSTLAQQLVLARAGVRDPWFLDFVVTPTAGRVLYLAMDRPRQIQRSLHRMVSDADRAALRDRLAVWEGPLPIDVLSTPAALADWIADEFGEGVSDVVVDSFKDLAPGLSEDSVGTRLNLAVQEVIARGIEVVGLHHNRKDAVDRKADYTIADVYGSRWITAGAGSVFLIVGAAGDAVVELRHIKQPAGVVGPLLVRHDHEAGVSRRESADMTPEAYLHSIEGEAVTVRAVVEAIYGEWSEKAEQRTRRRLVKVAAEDGSHVYKVAGSKGGAGGTTGDRWVFDPSREQPSSQPSPTRRGGGS